MAKKAAKTEATVTIHNLKSSNYRQIHVDGALGSLTPTGYINISFYSQRAPIPKGTEFSLSDEGVLGDRIKDISGSKVGIIREVELGVYMDINVCKQLVEFLQRRIIEHDLIQEKPEDV